MEWLGCFIGTMKVGRAWGTRGSSWWAQARETVNPLLRSMAGRTGNFHREGRAGDTADPKKEQSRRTGDTPWMDRVG